MISTLTRQLKTVLQSAAATLSMVAMRGRPYTTPCASRAIPTADSEGALDSKPPNHQRLSYRLKDSSTRLPLEAILSYPTRFWGNASIMYGNKSQLWSVDYYQVNLPTRQILLVRGLRVIQTTVRAVIIYRYARYCESAVCEDLLT